MERLIQLYKDWKGCAPAKVEEITGSGSNRSYYKMMDESGNKIIGVIGTSRDENRAFIYLSKHFEIRKLSVPKVLAVSEDELCYLQTCVGDVSLYDELRGGRENAGRYNQHEKELLIKTIRELPNIQIRGAIGLEWENCYPQPEYNLDSVLFDLNYFKYCFLKPSGIDFHELKLEADFRLFAKDLTAEGCDSFLYRDFQARNVMLDEHETPFFIDYQGGRKGPYYYDLASFLWQASARYSFKLRRELVYEYYHSLKNYIEVPPVRHFVERLTLFVLFRTLQVLGAYGFRGYFERKKRFIESIPPAMDNVRDLLKMRQCFPYPYLMGLLKKLSELPQYAMRKEEKRERNDGLKVAASNIYTPHPNDGPATFSKYEGNGPLVVKVFSFSFRKGIPEDDSGNGGGYVFDCRSIHNPGRYEPYKRLTGLDEPVIRFLEDDGEILEFLKSVYAIADKHVERYLQRGFTSLMFSFGCTGGQHRSVYSAQHLSEHLHSKYGVEVKIVHREQSISQILPAKM